MSRQALNSRGSCFHYLIFNPEILTSSDQHTYLYDEFMVFPGDCCSNTTTIHTATFIHLENIIKDLQGSKFGFNFICTNFQNHSEDHKAFNAFSNSFKHTKTWYHNITWITNYAFRDFWWVAEFVVRVNAMMRSLYRAVQYVDLMLSLE